ncbi:MAG: DUF2905 family protein [Betaproteobacteria bacterium]|nr:DUF2905 family protein [Betaproteobacteria bacterium]
MIKWLVVIVLLAIVAAWFDPTLRKRFPGGLSGDLRLRFAGREIRVALGMTILLSLLATLLLRRL